MVSNTSQMPCDIVASLCYMRIACIVFQRILSFLNHEHIVMYLAVEPSQAIVS